MFLYVVPLVLFAVTLVVYVAFMTNTAQEAPPKVQVYRQGKVIAIVASPDWTEDDWDHAVPADIQTMHPGDWNYRIIDGVEVWTINLAEVSP